MSGIPFPPVSTRLRMLDEALTCIRSLWTQEQTSFSGEFYQLNEAVLSPKPVQRPHPPILIGGGGRGVLRLAGKHADVVNIIGEVGKPGTITLQSLSQATETAFKEKARFARDEASRNSRKPDAVQISNAIFILMLTDSAAEAESMTRSVAQGIGLPAEQISRAPLALIGTSEHCAAELGRRAREWGVSQFIFSGAGLDLKLIRRLAGEVFPHVRN
jgi:alkanesulfonate monooxygenase SsuD/methylene tetrahydromethanopterin reductase-like flavin-dependent oxidoreductase (luciferase family)